VRGIATEALLKIGEAAVAPLAAALRSQASAVRRIAAEALGKLGGERTVAALIPALSDKDSAVRGIAAEALGRLADERAVGPLTAVLWDPHAEVRRIANKALHLIVEKSKPVQRALQAAYPHLACSRCGFRAERKRYVVGVFRRLPLIVCRHCQRYDKLYAGVKSITGEIGGDLEAFTLMELPPGARVPLWDEATKQSSNADIDLLVICAGGVVDYEWAIAAVVNTLKGDTSRPSDWCKKIPVTVDVNVKLKPGSVDLLRDAFKEVLRVIE